MEYHHSSVSWELGRTLGHSTHSCIIIIYSHTELTSLCTRIPLHSTISYKERSSNRIRNKCCHPAPWLPNSRPPRLPNPVGKTKSASISISSISNLIPSVAISNFDICPICFFPGHGCSSQLTDLGPGTPLIFAHAVHHDGNRSGRYRSQAP